MLSTETICVLVFSVNLFVMMMLVGSKIFMFLVLVLVMSFLVRLILLFLMRDVLMDLLSVL